MFICPKCKNELNGFFPKKCNCGYDIPVIESIYQFCDDPPISLEEDGHKYLGYEYVGENYDGNIENKLPEGDWGIFGASERKLVELLGKSCTVLDLGAGLGTTSIALAKAGANTISADISQRMLSAAVKRTGGINLEGNLIFTRMNGYNLTIKDGSIDAVVAIDMLHQTDNPESVVKEIIRVLKPDGVFVQYGCEGLYVTEEQAIINIKCNTILREIQKFYENALLENGYKGIPFSSWDKVNECIDKYFNEPIKYGTDVDCVWTEKMTKEINKMKARASGSKQLIPDEIHNTAWEKTDNYAKEKYGKNYINIPNYSHFTGIIKVYKVNK